MANVDLETVSSFGDEWNRHRQNDVSIAELEELFLRYFHIFPWDKLPAQPVGFDMGVGSGRWAQFVAPRVHHLHAIDASSQALAVARENLAGATNITFHHATTDTAPLAKDSCDFGYSLGVLHHIPDTRSALKDCVSLIKPGGIMMIYLYYRFDNRSILFPALWAVSDVIRKVLCRFPMSLRAIFTDTIAALVYFPLSRTAGILEKLGLNVSSFPLSAYRGLSFSTLRTDSRDRFGTPLEQRFTRKEIEQMMGEAGLSQIRFSEDEPFWCAVGVKTGPA